MCLKVFFEMYEPYLGINVSPSLCAGKILPICGSKIKFMKNEDITDALSLTNDYLWFMHHFGCTGQQRSVTEIDMP